MDEIGYLPLSQGGANLFFQLVNERPLRDRRVILTSSRGFAEWGEVLGDPVVATALDRLLHHAVVVQIEGASYRLPSHADLIPEHVRANAPIAPPPPQRRRGRPPRNGVANP